MEMQGLSCLWSCHCSGIHFALFNNLTNKLALLFCSCCAVHYQQGWLAYLWICLCFVCKAWVSLQLFFIFGWKSLKIKIQYECQKALQCEACCLCTILVEEISINFTLLSKDEYVTGLTSLKSFLVLKVIIITKDYQFHSREKRKGRLYRTFCKAPCC